MKKIMKNSVCTAVLLAGSVLLSGCLKARSITISLAPDQTLNTGRQVIVQVETVPGGVKIDPNSITITGGDSWVEGDVIKFQVDEPGDYKMTINQDNVQSNELVIPVTKADYSYHPADSSDQSNSSSAASSESSASASSEVSSSAAGERHVSVDEAFSDQENLIGQQTQITVSGQLPQTTIPDKSGKQVQVLWNDQASTYLILEGFQIPFGSCPAEVTGTLSRNENGELVLHMSYISTNTAPGPINSQTGTEPEQQNSENSESVQ